ncbi:hypothetical protein AOLI_G00259110 [Acnodon oligacanthus]
MQQDIQMQAEALLEPRRGSPNILLGPLLSPLLRVCPRLSAPLHQSGPSSSQALKGGTCADSKSDGASGAHMVPRLDHSSRRAHGLPRVCFTQTVIRRLTSAQLRQQEKPSARATEGHARGREGATEKEKCFLTLGGGSKEGNMEKKERKMIISLSEKEG